MKTRTSISVDDHIRREAQAIARRRGVSLSALVSAALEDLLSREGKRREKFPCTPIKCKLKPGESPARDHEKIAFMEHWKERSPR